MKTSAEAGKSGMKAEIVPEKNRDISKGEFLFWHTIFDDFRHIPVEPKEISIFYKYPYYLPYTSAKDYRGIRDLQLLVRRKNVFNRECFIFMDMTEWLGHDKEYFFQIMMKFLHITPPSWSRSYGRSLFPLLHPASG